MTITIAITTSSDWACSDDSENGKKDSIHHHLLLEVPFETAIVLELRQKPLYTTPSGWWWCWWCWWCWWWWWCIESVFREKAAAGRKFVALPTTFGEALAVAYLPDDIIINIIIIIMRSISISITISIITIVIIIINSSSSSSNSSIWYRLPDR